MNRQAIELAITKPQKYKLKRLLHRDPTWVSAFNPRKLKPNSNFTMPEIIDRVINTKLENQNELDWLRKERTKDPEMSILSSPRGNTSMTKSNRKKSSRTIDAYGRGSIADTETQYTEGTRPTFKQRLKNYWDTKESDESGKRVEAKVRKMKENQVGRDFGDEELPLTLPAGALGAHEI